MTKLHSINLKGITLGWFLLLSVLCPVKNIATNSNIRNEEPIYILTNSRGEIDMSRWGTRNYTVLKTDINTAYMISRMLKVDDALGKLRNIYRLLLIIGSISTSLYNYFTGHNKKKNGWYFSKFPIYFGIKKNFTKSFQQDLYFSLFTFFLYLPAYLLTGNLIPLLLGTIYYDINIRIYKNFYLSLSPKYFIFIGILHIQSASLRSETREHLLPLFQGTLPQNFNLSNIHCFLDIQQ